MISPHPETVHLPQLESTATARLLDIFYASGQRQQLKAVYRGPWIFVTGELFVMLSTPSSERVGARTGVFDELMGLDPLCVVVDTASAQVIYEPRMLLSKEGFPEQLHARLSASLEALPHWPRLLEFSEGENGVLSML